MVRKCLDMEDLSFPEVGKISFWSNESRNNVLPPAFVAGLAARSSGPTAKA
jgi:hypothetical protein